MKDITGQMVEVRCTSCMLALSSKVIKKSKTDILTQCDNCNKVLSKNLYNEINQDYHDTVEGENKDITIDECERCKLHSAVFIGSNWVCEHCHNVKYFEEKHAV